MRYARPAIVTVVMAALEYVLVTTRSGSIQLPTGLNVTVLAVPAIIAGILGGVVPGALVGVVFGATALSLATTPLFQNPVIAIVPRLLIGPAAALTYTLLRKRNEALALVVGGAVGAVVGTGLVLLLGTIVNGPIGAPYIAPDAARDVAIANIPSEATLGALSALVVGLAVLFIQRRRA